MWFKSWLLYDVPNMVEKIIVLDSIRSAYNVGAIFRTADGAGVAKVILGGYTPSPIDRFGRINPQIKKTSLGASQTMPYEVFDTLADGQTLLNKYKQQGYSIVAIEQADRAVSLYDFKVPAKVLYIMGNEIEGVSKEFLEMADEVVYLPMLGQKESLNVSVSAGIVMYYQNQV